ncbi:Mono(ADP-ribosyl)transferase [Fusarium agapanthi]|uniref:Mono(ADP-ribosyl)transferase n=1 Tax=Fusarium agapanthi TaxID=1803897 RepID=A0A9P5AX42_9HYPO|nr:Mono(ADP-ribosyl)transferase [Fusarium agapanthi]
MGNTADGQPEQILYGNGVLATSQYDSATRLMIRKRLIRQNDRRGMEDTQYSPDVMHRVIHSGNAAQAVSYFNNTAVDARCPYTYDTIGRLSSAQGREDANTNAREKSSVGILSDSTCICRYTEEYQYDDADNITQVKHHAGPKGQMWVGSYTYEEESLVKEGESGNRLSYTSKSGQTEKWTYGDGASTGFAGSVTAGGGIHSISWDPFNHLKSCSRQIKKSGTPETTWYVYNNPIGTKDGLNLYCYCGNDPLNYVDPTGTTGLFKAMRIAAVPLFKTTMGMNEITKMSPGFEPYQRSWLSEIFKSHRGSSPAVLDDVEFLTEDEKLRKLEDYNAMMERKA